jgi:anthranilate phosphoribosyltransferase
MIRDIIIKLADRIDISADEAAISMNEIMSGEATTSQIAAFLTALRMKGETLEEITGCARVMRDKAEKVCLSKDAIDIVGTGGDGANTFNISTCSAFVAAAAGLPVAKHGNRSASSKCGSADVLESLGVNITLTAEQAMECFNQTNICFMFAPVFHKSMKYVAPARKEIGLRTIFNFLGPLANPAFAPYQLLGVCDEKLVEPLAGVLLNLGVKGVLSVHSHDHLDEISISAPTTVVEVKDGKLSKYIIHPEDFGFDKSTIDDIRGGGAEENANIVGRIFSGEKGAKRDIVLMNSGAALYIAGKVNSIMDGIKLAGETLDSGAAMNKLTEYINATQKFLEAAK